MTPIGTKVTPVITPAANLLLRLQTAYRISRQKEDYPMYEAFDGFLARSTTWHTSHDNDIQSFNECLSKVVYRKDFNADKMSEYFQAEKGPGFEQAIAKWRAAAWAVKDFLTFKLE